MSDDSNAYIERFKTLIGFVEEAMEKVAGDDMPDLSSLDSDVSKLCEDVEAASQEVGDAVQPHMTELIAKLDQLAQALTAYQQKIQATADDEQKDGE